jgi:6-phosphogluconolactonase
MAKLSGYIGAYTEGTGKSAGIYYFSMDAGSGVIEEFRLAAEDRNPAYLALSPSGEFLYAVNEVDGYGDTPHGAVSAYGGGEGGALKFLNRVSSKGAGPCHISVHRDGNLAVVANYSGGTLAALPVGKRGRLGEAVQVIVYKGSGPNAGRQEKAHAHSFTFAPDGSHGFACDLGSDRVMLYHVDPKSKGPLVPWEEPFAAALPGYGPRHGVFHPSGRWAYVLNELESAVDVFACGGGGGSAGGRRGAADSSPSFTRLQTVSTLPRRNKTKSIASAIRIGPGGKFLYASNRGHDSIAVFEVLPTGRLGLTGLIPSGGRHPRDFALDPRGRFLLALNRDSDNLVVFRIDRRTGLPAQEREYPALSPTAIVFR